jgi:hypothetical protein
MSRKNTHFVEKFSTVLIVWKEHKMHLFNVFYLPCINQVLNIQITNKMHFCVYYVFHSQFSHQHVLANP